MAVTKRIRIPYDHAQMLKEFTEYQQKQFVTRYYNRYVHNMVEARAKVRTNNSQSYDEQGSYRVMEISVSLYMNLLAMLDFVQLKYQQTIVPTAHLNIHCIDGADQRKSNATLINNVLREPQSGNLFGFIGAVQVFYDTYFNDTKTRQELIDFKKQNTCILMPCLRLNNHLMIKELQCGVYLVNYFKHCTFRCGRKNGNKMFVIKQNDKLAKKLEKFTTRNNGNFIDNNNNNINTGNNNHKYGKKSGNVKNNINLNCDFGIDLFIYQLTVPRLRTKEKINIIKDL